MAKAAEQKTAGVLVNLTEQQRAAVERVAEREQTSLSHVARRAIVRDLKRRAKEES